ncbi:hypothetical protein L210DRAFT_3547863, partial [Boletus edulis BED1]
VPTRAHDKQSIAALPDPNYHPSTAVMVAQYCPSCSHHEDYRRPCLTQLSSTMPTMSECPTLKYSQPWVNTSQPSSCRLAQRVPSLHHRCRIVRTDPSSCRRTRRNTAFPPPPATCLRALSGRAGEKACAGCRGRQSCRNDVTIDVLLGFFGDKSEVFTNLARDGVKVLMLAKVEETISILKGWKDGDVVKGHCCVDRNIGSNFEAEHSLESRRMSRSNNE